MNELYTRLCNDRDYLHEILSSNFIETPFNTSLPSNITNIENGRLNDFHILQIISINDIGKSNRSKDCESKGNRMLKLELTDGKQTLYAYEYKKILEFDFICDGSIKCLSKIAIYNNPVIRRGTLWLLPENVKILFQGFRCLTFNSTECNSDLNYNFNDNKNKIVYNQRIHEISSNNININNKNISQNSINISNKSQLKIIHLINDIPKIESETCILEGEESEDELDSEIKDSLSSSLSFYTYLAHSKYKSTLDNKKSLGKALRHYSIHIGRSLSDRHAIGLSDVYLLASRMPFNSHLFDSGRRKLSFYGTISKAILINHRMSSQLWLLELWITAQPIIYSLACQNTLELFFNTNKNDVDNVQINIAIMLYTFIGYLDVSIYGYKGHMCFWLSDVRK